MQRKKKKTKEQLILDWNNEVYPSRFMGNSYAEEYDRLETEIELLKHLLEL
ncbi:MAG: hypothetical protein ACRCX2_09695 [Paraclostridium sp.]